jgi:hypothetical protein
MANSIGRETMKIPVCASPFMLGTAVFLFLCQFSMAQEAKKEDAGFVKFKAHLVDRLRGGYKVDAADINSDGKLDIIGLATRPPSLVWYKNPTWEKYVLTSHARDYIDLAPYDIDKDGRVDLAIAHEFGMRRTTSGGLLHWLKCPQDRTQEWPMYFVGAEPTSHRIKWADINGDGRKELVNAPIMGRNAKGPLWNVGVNLIWYEIPEPATRQLWKPHIIDDQLTVIHGISIVNWNNDRYDDILVASFDGVHLYQPQIEGNSISWKKTKLGAGEQVNPAKRGSSEVAVGKIQSDLSDESENRRFIATIEPWHGNNVVVYTPSLLSEDSRGSGPHALWQRSVIDATFNEGHALICADLDGDGNDEIIAGYRGIGHSLYIYRCQDSVGNRWKRTALDEGDMAASGLCAADIDHDGRLDVICVGTATSNIKWYQNLDCRQTSLGPLRKR